MYQSNLYSLNEAAMNLGISLDLVYKFIQMGLITAVNDGQAPKLTSYNMRRLIRVIDLYEKSYSPDRIEFMINN